MEKNVFLIPTSEASRLIKNQNDKLLLTIQTLPLDSGLGCFPQYIYITNNEEIKYCYVLTDLDKIVKINKDNEELWHQYNSKKIVLTNDPKLETVQQLTEEQLREFVNNPCEFVEVVKELRAFDSQNRYVEYAMEKGDYVKSFYSVSLTPYLSRENKKQTEEKYTQKDMEEAFNTGFRVGYYDEESPSYLTFEEWIKNYKKCK